MAQQKDGWTFQDGLQGGWDTVTGKRTRENQKEAAKAAERARRDSIVRQFGARQQAESMAFAGLQRPNSGGGSNNAPGIVGSQDAQGTIGANIAPTNGTSGTF